jgi:hypothetical protein
MGKILLDYVFPISVISPTPAASTAFLKQVCVIAKPKNGVTPGTVTLCTSKDAVAALTANTNADQLFDAGMSKVYVLPMATLDLHTAFAEAPSTFFTVLICDDFGDADLSALALGAFDGVTGFSTQSSVTAKAQAVLTDRCCFKTNVTNKAKNMFTAFGTLLSNQVNWTNQQYISMPLDDSIATLGDAEDLFDSKVSFVMADSEFGNRLAMFAAGSKAIVAPYIIKNLQINLQSKALQWISGNQPQYTIKEASLLEARLQEDVINNFIARQWIEAGVVDVQLLEENFVAQGYINVSEPKALWRVFSELRQTL